MREICHVVSPAEDLTRLDALLAGCGAYSSRSAAARAIDAGDVLVDGVPRSKSYAPRTGESVFCRIEEESPKSALLGEDIPLDVRFEDEWLAVISKQAGLICHPSPDHDGGTLVNALIHRYGASGLCNVQGDFDRPGIVHRLDGDTSGLMLVAKDDEAGKRLMEAIALKQVERRYVALVHGIVSVDTGMIDAPIERCPSDRKKMAVGDGSSSRDAITTFKVLERFAGDGRNDGYTLVECKLYTGRTHQIRVHMQYIGHPIVGDPLYNAKGPKDSESQLRLSRQFLHSWKIGFDHPMTEERIELRDGFPNDLEDALAGLSGRSAGKVGDAACELEQARSARALACGDEQSGRGCDA